MVLKYDSLREGPNFGLNLGLTAWSKILGDLDPTPNVSGFLGGFILALKILKNPDRIGVFRGFLKGM